jgi:hypothetical protein
MKSRIHFAINERLPFADSMAFGAAGSYEILHGRVTAEVAPASVPPDSVADLALAPLSASGLISCVSDFALLRPTDPAKGNRRILFDYANRGAKRALQFFNDAPFSNRPVTAQHAGNGFLMRRGYAVLWLGWQGDLMPGEDRLVLDLPVAQDGVQGRVRTEFIVDEPGMTTMPLSGRVSTRSYPIITRDKNKAAFTRRRYPDSEPMPILLPDWEFAREEKGIGMDFVTEERAIVPSDTHVYLRGGFEPGWIYELIYEARDPLILGLGQIVIRDVVDFLKTRDTDDGHNPNPLGRAEKAYAWGRSQTGRAVRDFVYRGFNDADGRRVFDGIIANAAGGGRIDMSRFANLYTAGSQQYEDHVNQGDAFPFAYAACRDPVSGRTDAILKRPATDPLVVHINSSSEYWQRRGSLVHTDADGNDLPEPANVRLYHWASSQHSSDPTAPKPRRGRFENFNNIVQTSCLFRATLDALDAWATGGYAPPPSLIPRRRDGTLISFAEWRERFPKIPGLTLPQRANDFASSGAFPVFVAAPDHDGNETAGVRAPMVAAPLATYTGWNIRAPGFGDGAMHSFNGSTILFPETEEDAKRLDDPRKPILARYKSAADYAAAIRKAAEDLVRRGLMLEEDVARVVQAASDWGRPRHDVKL